MKLSSPLNTKSRNAYDSRKQISMHSTFCTNLRQVNKFILWHHDTSGQQQSLVIGQEVVYTLRPISTLWISLACYILRPLKATPRIYPCSCSSYPLQYTCISLPVHGNCGSESGVASYTSYKSCRLLTLTSTGLKKKRSVAVRGNFEGRLPFAFQRTQFFCIL
jgi:hypothetical protein